MMEAGFLKKKGDISNPIVLTTITAYYTHINKNNLIFLNAVTQQNTSDVLWRLHVVVVQAGRDADPSLPSSAEVNIE